MPSRVPDGISEMSIYISIKEERTYQTFSKNLKIALRMNTNGFWHVKRHIKWQTQSRHKISCSILVQRLYFATSKAVLCILLNRKTKDTHASSLFKEQLCTKISLHTQILKELTSFIICVFFKLIAGFRIPLNPQLKKENREKNNQIFH